MTLDEFLEQLGKFGKGKFRLSRNSRGLIRHYYESSKYNDGDLCPLEYVYARVTHQSKDDVYGEYDKAEQRLQLQDLSDKIMKAADGHIDPAYPELLELRQKMLEVLGLEKTSE